MSEDPGDVRARDAVNTRTMFAQRSTRNYQGDQIHIRKHAKYPHRLNFYSVPPTDTITIHMFEEYALARLKILRALEMAQLRNQELAHVLAEAETENLLLCSNSADTERLDEERHRDYVSHFILRLAYARSEDLRNWFVRYETLLFRLRLERETISDRMRFFRSLDIEMDTITSSERQELIDLQLITDAADTLYKVEWTRILDLVMRRKCIVYKGYAYIVAKDQINLIVNEFKARLADRIDLTARLLPQVDEDERLKPVLTNMSHQYLGRQEYNQVNGKVLASDVEQISHLFPPCMRHLHQQLKLNGHLKHGGRMQYGLFLKGVGLPIEEALVFWRKMFRHFTDEQFQKNYAYNIRHNYGLEGKRSNYSPYACVRIITSNPPGAGDHHGCPFKHFSQDRLRETLYAHVAPDKLHSVLEKAKDGHAQLACTEYLACKLPNEQIAPIEHPNQFYHQMTAFSQK